jgi:SH3-like domain-containing protein
MAFFLAIATVLLFILATALSLTQLRAATDSSRAVILTNDTTPVHASPDSGSKIIRQPSQGVTVQMERTQGDWTEVRFADGEKGWLRTRSVEVI